MVDYGVESHYAALSERTDAELIGVWRVGKANHGGKIINPLFIDCQPESFYEAAAAVDILRRKYGTTYVENLVLGEPKTFLGRVGRALGRIGRYFSQPTW